MASVPATAAAAAAAATSAAATAKSGHVTRPRGWAGALARAHIFVRLLTASLTLSSAPTPETPRASAPRRVLPSPAAKARRRRTPWRLPRPTAHLGLVGVGPRGHDLGQVPSTPCRVSASSTDGQRISSRDRAPAMLQFATRSTTPTSYARSRNFVRRRAPCAAAAPPAGARTPRGVEVCAPRAARPARRAAAAAAAAALAAPRSAHAAPGGAPPSTRHRPPRRQVSSSTCST